MSLRLEIRGVVETRAALRQFTERIADMELLWLDYGDILARFEAEWFASEGRGAWPPLAESTLKWKLAHGYPADPMIRTGNLLESLTNQERAMEVGQGRSTLGTFTRDSFSWGTDAKDERGREYAHFHQDGEGKNPVRQVIAWPLPADVEAELDNANRRFVDEVILSSGL